MEDIVNIARLVSSAVAVLTIMTTIITWVKVNERVRRDDVIKLLQEFRGLSFRKLQSDWLLQLKLKHLLHMLKPNEITKDLIGLLVNTVSFIKHPTESVDSVNMKERTKIIKMFLSCSSLKHFWKENGVFTLNEILKCGNLTMFVVVLKDHHKLLCFTHENIEIQKKALTQCFLRIHSWRELYPEGVTEIEQRKICIKILLKARPCFNLSELKKEILAREDCVHDIELINLLKGKENENSRKKD